MDGEKRSRGEDEGLWRRARFCLTSADGVGPELLEQAAQECAQVLRCERARARELLRTRTRWLDEPELLEVLAALDRLVTRADELAQLARALPRTHERR